MKTLTRKEWEERIRENLSKAASWYGEPYDHLTIELISKIMWVPVTEALPEKDIIIEGYNKEIGKGGFGTFMNNPFNNKPAIKNVEGYFLTITHWTYPILPEDVK